MQEQPKKANHAAIGQFDPRFRRLNQGTTIIVPLWREIPLLLFLLDSVVGRIVSHTTHIFDCGQNFVYVSRLVEFSLQSSPHLRHEYSPEATHEARVTKLTHVSIVVDFDAAKERLQ